jgi:hypothetical protein
VLANVAERQAQAQYERLSAPATTPVPSSLPPVPEAVFEPHVAPMPSELPTTEPAARPQARRGSRPRTVVREGVRLSTAILVGLGVAIVGAVGFYFAEPWLRPGLLVITSDPAGAEITLDGVRVGATPRVVEQVWLSRPHEVVLESPGMKPATMVVEPQPGMAYRRVHRALETALGSLRVESEPAGAEVRLDDKVMGVTPITLTGVKIDAQHRIDLTLAGYEVDQVVVLPEKDGPRVVRKLARASARPATATP